MGPVHVEFLIKKKKNLTRHGKSDLRYFPFRGKGSNTELSTKLSEQIL